MASLKDIKSRIGSVKSTEKITNAMKLMSAAKFARASHAVQAARPYGEAFARMVSQLLASAGEEIRSPLLRTNEEKRILLIVVTTDRGLCGSLNTNLYKMAGQWVREKRAQGANVKMVAWGRRAQNFANKEKVEVLVKKEKVLDKPNYSFARDAALEFSQWFEEGQYDAIYLAYPRFTSALAQTPVLQKLLPVSIEGLAKEEQQNGSKDIIIEPSLQQLIDLLLMRKVTGTIYQILLDGAASEHGSRMTAMDSATKNAKEVVKKLTLAYNRARQAKITTELTEIISGAEALH